MASFDVCVNILFIGVCGCLRCVRVRLVMWFCMAFMNLLWAQKVCCCGRWHRMMCVCGICHSPRVMYVTDYVVCCVKMVCCVVGRLRCLCGFGYSLLLLCAYTCVLYFSCACARSLAVCRLKDDHRARRPRKRRCVIQTIGWYPFECLVLLWKSVIHLFDCLTKFLVTKFLLLYKEKLYDIFPFATQCRTCMEHQPCPKTLFSKHILMHICFTKSAYCVEHFMDVRFLLCAQKHKYYGQVRVFASVCVSWPVPAKFVYIILSLSSTTCLESVLLVCAILVLFECFIQTPFLP